jgi:N-acetylmuramoyl-L-alanine amidase
MMKRLKVVGIAIAAVLAVSVVEGAVDSASGAISHAMQRYRAESETLDRLARDRDAPAGSRTAWYLGKLASGMSAAHDMLRQMILLTALAEHEPATPARAKSVRLAGRRIILDPGHGGNDPGATGTCRQGGEVRFKLAEKDLTLDVSRRLAERLRGAGAEVLLTRDADETLDLFGRGAVGRMLDADLFMSIHFNYSVLCEPQKKGDRGVDGVNYTTVYIYSPSRRNLPMPGYGDLLADRLHDGTPAASARLASLLFQRLSSALELGEHPTDRVRRLMRVEQSRRTQLAKARQKLVKWKASPSVPSTRASESAPAETVKLYNEFYARQPEKSLPKGVRRSDFVVLREIDNKPAVLVETCFLGDQAELLRLQGNRRREAISEALYQGVCDYLPASRPEPRPAVTASSR